jgi:hypothetical protein
MKRQQGQKWLQGSPPRPLAAPSPTGETYAHRRHRTHERRTLLRSRKGASATRGSNIGRPGNAGRPSSADAPAKWCRLVQ